MSIELKLPRSYEDTKVHKELNICHIFFCKTKYLSSFVANLST